MLIISKSQDYYDYLSGIYGIDKDIVLDRRGACLLGTWDDKFKHLWNKDISYFQDKQRQVEKTRRFFKSRYFDFSKPLGNIFFIVLEVGFTHYFFKVERYLDNDNNVQIEHDLIGKECIENKLCDTPIGIMTCQERPWTSDKLIIDSKSKLENVILRDTWIPKYIPAEEIYNEIYNYLIAVKDKDMTDSRTDVQKAESHGFNKESFRNPTRVKDLK